MPAVKKKVNGRTKGHSFERKLKNLFIELGWENCKTSRNESKVRDDLKVDLCNTGCFNVQAKAVEKLGSLHTILDSMPDEEGKHNVVFHKKNRQGTIVAMKEEDFFDIVRKMIKAGIIIPA